MARRPLHTASQEGHEAVVRLLLDRGADINAARIDGATMSARLLRCTSWRRDGTRVCASPLWRGDAPAGRTSAALSTSQSPSKCALTPRRTAWSEAVTLTPTLSSRRAASGQASSTPSVAEPHPMRSQM
jgi:hypothetical protein